MYRFVVVLQGYDRSVGRSFTSLINLYARDEDEARAQALEAAVYQHLPVAVVRFIQRLGDAPEEQGPQVLHRIDLNYLDDLDDEEI